MASSAGAIGGGKTSGHHAARVTERLGQPDYKRRKTAAKEEDMLSVCQAAHFRTGIGAMLRGHTFNSGQQENAEEAQPHGADASVAYNAGACCPPRAPAVQAQRGRFSRHSAGACCPDTAPSRQPQQRAGRDVLSCQCTRLVLGILGILEIRRIRLPLRAADSGRRNGQEKASSRGVSVTSPRRLRYHFHDASIAVWRVRLATRRRDCHAEIPRRRQARTGQREGSALGSAGLQPSFDPSTPSNITAMAGKAAYLTCRVRNIGNRTVSWIRHRDLAILSAGQQTYAHDSRMTLYHQPDSDEWVLRIKYVQPRDAGTYGCQLPTTPLTSFPIELSVVVPRTRILGDTEIYVDIGSTLNLTCTVSYSPEPIEFIFWYQNETVVNYNSSPSGRVTIVSERSTTTNSYLLIQAARVQDSGIYTCSPSNAQVAKVKVHVLKGEKPAAMQTNGVAALSACAWLVAIATVRWVI
ncbi:uncharacterized protein LOC119095242 [Pollicipes pollicipes]|uniref:uncharacterized protein LOC119095242 n=1 Tax=Pollicipes pollicipes TaxID=41117 RepID=UPI0018858E18|nr:uncharacterized protein LOC119095242 [Pollicipes pollicipes]